MGAKMGRIARGAGRLRRSSRRVGQRIAGLPVRWAERARGLPVPPSRFLHAVGNSDDPSWFLRAGRWAFEDILALLAAHGEAVDGLGAVLDFGCGVGRVARHWADHASRGLEVTGVDSNPELIAWCRRHLPFGRFAANDPDGRIDAPDGAFGLAYALSVFTHMGPRLQRHWMDELARVLRPGGFLLLTTHGLPYRDLLAPDHRERFDRLEAVVVGDDREGSNHCASFHHPDAVAATLALGWHQLDWWPAGARGNPQQDVFFLRKPAALASAG